MEKKSSHWVRLHATALKVYLIWEYTTFKSLVPLTHRLTYVHIGPASPSHRIDFIRCSILLSKTHIRNNRQVYNQRHRHHTLCVSFSRALWTLRAARALVALPVIVFKMSCKAWPIQLSNSSGFVDVWKTFLIRFLVWWQCFKQHWICVWEFFSAAPVVAAASASFFLLGYEHREKTRGDSTKISTSSTLYTFNICIPLSLSLGSLA